MAPRPGDLFLNAWVQRLHSGEHARPGTNGWDPEKENRYWARVWLHCRELARHLEQCEQRMEAAETGLQELDAEGPESKA